MGKRSNFERRERDFYPTPFSAVFPLIKHLKKGDTFSEPCCGQNDLVQHLQFYNFMCTSATDIDRGFDLFNIKPHDFSVISSKYFITNPPWPQASGRGEPTLKIIKHLSALKPTWLLLPADFCQNKYFNLVSNYCSKIIAVGRVKWIKGSKHVSKENCCWYLFNKHNKKITKFYGREQRAA